MVGPAVHGPAAHVCGGARALARHELLAHPGLVRGKRVDARLRFHGGLARALAGQVGVGGYVLALALLQLAQAQALLGVIEPGGLQGRCLALGGAYAALKLALLLLCLVSLLALLVAAVGVALVAQRLALHVDAEVVFAVRAAQAIDRAVARLAVERRVFLGLARQTENAALPLGVALARAAVRGGLHEVVPRLLKQLQRVAAACLYHLGAHVAAHGHVGLRPRPALVVHDGHAPPRQLQHGLAGGLLVARHARVHLRHGLRHDFEVRALHVGGHLQVVSAHHFLNARRRGPRRVVEPPLHRLGQRAHGRAQRGQVGLGALGHGLGRSLGSLARGSAALLAHGLLHVLGGKRRLAGGLRVGAVALEVDGAYERGVDARQAQGVFVHGPLRRVGEVLYVVRPQHQASPSPSMSNAPPCCSGTLACASSLVSP